MQAAPKQNHYGVDNLRRSLGHFALGKGVGGIIGVFWLLLLVRALPAGDYGIYVGFVAYLELFNVLSNFGLSPISERFVPEYRARNDEPRLRALIFKLVLLRVLVVCTLASVMATLASRLVLFLGFGIEPQAFVIFHVVVAADSIARYVETIFASLMLQGRTQISMFSRTGIRLFMLLLALNQSQGDTLDLVHLVSLEALASSCGLVITVYLLWRAQNILGTAPNTSVALLPLLSFAAPIYASEVVGSLLGIDVVKLLVLKTTGAEASAIFGFCASLALYLMRYLPSFLLVGMVRPVIVAAATDPTGDARLQRIVSIILKLNAILIGYALAISLSIGDQLISVLSGGKFASGSGYLSVFLLFTMSQTLRAPYSYSAIACGQGHAMLSGQLTGVFILALGVVGSDALGLYAYCAALVAIDLVAFKWVQRALNTCGVAPALPWVGLAKITVLIAIGLAIGMCLEYLLPTDWSVWQQVAVISIAIGLIFAILGVVIRPFSRGELETINRILPKRLVFRRSASHTPPTL
jgi:O-antigen/teichoic acid export membrane protein